MATLIGAPCGTAAGAPPHPRSLPMSNPVFEAVRTVLAVREYQDREVPADVLDRIVQAGHLSASSRNLQPWHFVVVRDRQGLRDLGRLVRTGPYVTDAAAAIVVASERESPFAVS